MVRKGTIDARPIGELYKRTRHSERPSEYEPQNLRQIRLILLWDDIKPGRTVHFWTHRVSESGIVTPIPTVQFKPLDLTIIGSIFGRNNSRFRVDVIYGTAPNLKLRFKDYVALIEIITQQLQEEFPDKEIKSFTKDVISIEEQAPWES